MFLSKQLKPYYTVSQMARWLSPLSAKLCLSAHMGLIPVANSNIDKKNFSRLFKVINVNVLATEASKNADNLVKKVKRQNLKFIYTLHHIVVSQGLSI